MARLTNHQRSGKTGLSPGTMVHIGQRKTERVTITVIDYNEQTLEERQVASFEECRPYRDRTTVTWINVDGLHQIEVIEGLGKCFNLHPLVLEDIVAATQRPKQEDYGDYLYIVLKMIYQHDPAGKIIAEQISLVVGPTWVLSFQEAGGDVFDPVRERLRSSRGRLRKMGADFLAYSLLDAVVDNYFVVLESIGERTEGLEEGLVSRNAPKFLKDIQRLKRDLIDLRKSVWPLREVLSGLQRGESALFAEGTRIFLRDVYDHTIQVIDSVETYRDMASGMLDIYLSSINNRMNEIMKVLTIMSSIFIPLTFIAGVYGMNFRYMPELEQPWGYPLVLGVMGLASLGMLFFFKRKKWF